MEVLLNKLNNIKQKPVLVYSMGCLLLFTLSFLFTYYLRVIYSPVWMGQVKWSLIIFAFLFVLAVCWFAFARLKDKNMPEEMGSFTRFPDIIMMDGGKGQVNVCLQVLEELGLHIPVCGMVKDDFHRTRGLYYNNEEIPIDTHSEGFKLITRIQDEAHRFAIEYHRSLRSKSQVKSVLDDIPGIGPARRKALMKRYQSIENIRNASVEDLLLTEAMNRTSAEKVYQFFHTQSEEQQDNQQ